MDDLVVGEYLIQGEELEEIFTTSGGPGGQHANRTETAVRLRFDVEASSLPDAVRTRLIAELGPLVEVTVSDSRSQFRNRAIARQRLQTKLIDALKESKPRRPTRPTKTSQERRVDEKKARGETKRMRQTPPLEE